MRRSYFTFSALRAKWLLSFVYSSDLNPQIFGQVVNGFGRIIVSFAAAQARPHKAPERCVTPARPAAKETMRVLPHPSPI